MKIKLTENDLRIRIMEMAIYHETKGLMTPATSNKILPRAKHFKQLLANGTFNIDELERRVYGLEN